MAIRLASRKKARRLALGVLALSSLACGGRSTTDLGASGTAGAGAGGGVATGGIGGAAGTTGAGGSTMTGGGGAGGSGPPDCGQGAWCPMTCNKTEAAFAPARIWRITDQEYVNITSQILGVALAGADAQISGPPDSTGIYTNFADDTPPFSDTMAANYQSAAEKVAALASTAPNMTRLLGSATPTPDQITSFLKTKVARLLRRPVTPTEVATLQKIYDLATADPADGGPRHGFSLILEAVLQWPSFLFRTELGATPPASTPFKLTPHELATAASFALTDSAPDDMLWSHADDGSLSSPSVLAVEVDRLMALRESQNLMTKYALALDREAPLSTKGPHDLSGIHGHPSSVAL